MAIGKELSLRESKLDESGDMNILKTDYDKHLRNRNRDAVIAALGAVVGVASFIGVGRAVEHITSEEDYVSIHYSCPEGFDGASGAVDMPAMTTRAYTCVDDKGGKALPEGVTIWHSDDEGIDNGGQYGAVYGPQKGKDLHVVGAAIEDDTSLVLEFSTGTLSDSSSWEPTVYDLASTVNQNNEK